MPKTTVKEESKKGKEGVAEGKPEEKKEEKIKGEAKKAEMKPKRKEKEGEKDQVAVEEKASPGEWDEPNKEVKEGESKVEEVAEVKRENGPKVEEIIGTVEKMTVLELSDLVKALEERFGVVAVAPTVAGMAPAAAPAEEAKEKTEWSVILTAVGEKKIQVIKEVRAVTNLGLKEAKTLVEEAPKPVKEGISQKEAEEVKAKLESAGATVELK